MKLAGWALVAALPCGAVQAQVVMTPPEFDVRVEDMQRLMDPARAADQTRKAVAYMRGSDGYPRDRRKGCGLARKASHANADAMQLVGLCYQYGYDGARDPAKAAAAFRRAQEMGHREAPAAAP